MKFKNRYSTLLNKNSLTALSGALSFFMSTHPNNSLAANKPSPDQKNIIFIICDDLNHTQGPAAHPQTKAPNLDQLAKRGVSFINAQCNAPLCAPSRYSLTTGLYPHSLGLYEYVFIKWDKLPNASQTVPYMDFMKQNGYRVYGAGKVFHNHSEKMNAFTWPDGSDHCYSVANWGPWPWNGTHKGRSDWGWALPHPSMPPTFSHDSSYAPLSDIPTFSPDPDKGIAGASGWWIDRNGKQHQPFHYTNETDRDLMPDEENTKWVKTLLQGEVEEPFIISIGMNRPHAPLYAPKKYFEMFPLETLQLPETLKNDLEDVAPDLQRDAPNRAWGYIKYDHIINRNNCNGDNKNRWKEWLQAYLANIAFVDDQIGKIMTALDNSPYAEDTLIIVTSDNGYHTGQKEYIHKNTLWTESANIPMICAGPGVAQNKTCERPVSLVDLYPTFLDYAGIKEDPYSQSARFSLAGSSLRPLLENPEQEQWDGPPVALTEISGNPHPNYSPFIERLSPDDFHYAVRSKNYRYIRTKNGQEELYDHRKDPYEWKNLAADPAFKGVLKYHRTQMNHVLNK